MHSRVIEECQRHWDQRSDRMRYKSDAAVSALLSARIRKVHDADLIACCSAAELLRARHIVEMLCHGARGLGLRYVGAGNRKHWATVAGASAETGSDANGSPTEAHGANLLKGDGERALAVEDVVLLAEACGMNVMSFELSQKDEPIFEQHVELARAGIRMNQDARGFLRDHLLSGALARARGFTESTDVKDLEVVQEGWDERVLGRARRMAEDTAAPIPIYMDKKFYWIRLHEPPPQLHGAQAYYIDRFPPKDENPAVINLDVFPVSSRIMEAKRVDLPKLELFGNSGDGRMAVLLVREDNETLRVLPRRLDQLRARAADAKRLASGKDKASREAAAAEDLEGEADAERVRWLVSTLPPEHLWLARRDYTLLSTSDR